MNSTNNQLIDDLSTLKNRFDIDKIVIIALSDSQTFNTLLKAIYHSNTQIAMRASWILSHCAEKEIAQIAPHQNYFVKAIIEIKSESIKRSLTKILSLLPISSEMDGLFFDKCIEAVISKQTAIANKAYTIEILLKYAKKYPELSSEIIKVLELAKEGASKGVSGKIKTTIKKLTILQANL